MWAAATVAFWTAAKLTSISIWFERRPTAFRDRRRIAPADRAHRARHPACRGGRHRRRHRVDRLRRRRRERGRGSSCSGAASTPQSTSVRRGRSPSRRRAAPRSSSRSGSSRTPTSSSSRASISETELGIYTLASRLGLVVSFLPQGFRMAMRPLRKAAIFQAVSDEYGQRDAEGPAPRLLHPALHLRRPGDDPPRRGDRRDRAARVRGRRRR